MIQMKSLVDNMSMRVFLSGLVSVDHVDEHPSCLYVLLVPLIEGR